jgi:L,D-peptidoglycan transpeptidase YkuD (ErfK/YbiS/YcfS/YnhG family)
MDTFRGGIPPDLWFGVPEEKFYNYLDKRAHKRARKDEFINPSLYKTKKINADIY